MLGILLLNEENDCSRAHLGREIQESRSESPRWLRSLKESTPLLCPHFLPWVVTVVSRFPLSSASLAFCCCNKIHAGQLPTIRKGKFIELPDLKTIKSKNTVLHLVRAFLLSQSMRDHHVARWNKCAGYLSPYEATNFIM